MTSPSYPVALDALANPGPTTETDDVGYELDIVVSRLQNCIMALEGKLGIGASSPGAAAAVLRRTGTGSSAWAQLLAADLSPDALLAGLADDPITNGGFNVWQRGTSFPAVVSSTYTADRWPFFHSTTTGVFAISQSSDVPAIASTVPGATSSLLVTTSTGDAAIGAAEYAFVRQIIEGRDWLPFAQQPFCIGFWAQASGTGVTGTYSVSAFNAGQDRGCVMEYQIAAPSIWEYKTVAFPASPAAGTWNYGTGAGLYLNWALAAGSTFAAAPGAWASSGPIGSTGQINAVGTAGNTLRIWGVTMGRGATVAPFWPRPYWLDELRCRRYYQRFVAVNGSGRLIPLGRCIGASDAQFYAAAVPPMRVAPTELTVSSMANMRADALVARTMTGLVLQPTIGSANVLACQASGISGTNTTGTLYELFGNVAGDWVAFGAEL